jgi:hypothetical protein
VRFSGVRGRFSIRFSSVALSVLPPATAHGTATRTSFFARRIAAAMSFIPRFFSPRSTLAFAIPT